MPTVSVIITTYNRAGYVTKAIESVLSQTYRDWELVIVNDGSSDQTEEVVRRYVTADSKVRYVKQTNQGLSGARNKGISETNGKYVTFLDDDDWWLPEKLETQVLFMEEHPEIGLSYTQLRIIREVNGAIDESTIIPVKMATTLEEILNDSFLPASTVMIRRKCLDAIEWFKIDAVPQEDFEMWLRFVQHWKIAAIRIPLTAMRKSGRAQLSRDTVRSFKKEIEIIDALQLMPEYQYCKGLKLKSRARIHYQLGRVYLDEEINYFEAAKHFLRALLIYPLVGLMVRRPEEVGLKLLARIAKSYATVPVCLVKGFIHAWR